MPFNTVLSKKIKLHSFVEQVYGDIVIMKITDEFKPIGILGIIMVALGGLGSLASIYVSGLPGIITSITVIVIILVVCYWLLRPVLLKNMRGVTMLEAVKSVGLVDIEKRDDEAHPLPPIKFYELAQHEIVISGVTAYRTFNQHISSLQEYLHSGKKLYVLLVDPDSEDIKHATLADQEDIRGQILQTISIIKNKKLIDEYPGFQIKFSDRIQPFSSIMIDGDISPTGKALDQGAQIRVQPTTMHVTRHTGIIIQLKKMQGYKHCTFDYFAEDLRKQWQVAKEMSNWFAPSP